MATIRLNDDWKIKSDEHQWGLYRAKWISEGTKKAKELGLRGRRPVAGRYLDWVGVRYYTSLSDALCGFVRREVMTADMEGIEAIRAEIARAEAVVRRAVQADAFGKCC